MKKMPCGQCDPCLDDCCCFQMGPWPAPSRAMPGRAGEALGPFYDSEGAECCGVRLLKYQPVAWNWDPLASGMRIYNPDIGPCATPEYQDVRSGTFPPCLDEWLSNHGGFDQVMVAIGNCTLPDYDSLPITGYVNIPRAVLDMIPKEPSESCNGETLMMIAPGQFACVIIRAVDGSEIHCTTDCFSGFDSCVECSSGSGSSSGGSSSGSGSGSGSGGSGSGPGSGGDSSSSSSGGSSDGSSSGTSSGSGSGGGDNSSSSGSVPTYSISF